MKTYYAYDRNLDDVFRQKGVEVQFYEPCPINDIKEIVEEEEIVKAKAYYKKVLPWREEFNQTQETNEAGEIIQEDYITSNKQTLFDEAQYITD